MRLLIAAVLLILLWAILALTVAHLIAPSSGNDPLGAEPPEAKPVVCVVNYPLEYFARRIVKDRATIEFPAPRAVDPAYWKPDQEAIWSFQEADLVLLNGADYAEWIDEAMLLEEKTSRTSEPFQNQYLKMDVVGKSPGGKNMPSSQPPWDGHTWLDPQLAVIQARAVRQALRRLVPEHGEEFDRNYESLERDLQALDASIKEVSSNYIDQPLLAAQPVYPYLARRCGWNMKSLDWKPDQVPDAHQWQMLADLLKDHPAKWILWVAPPKQETIDRLKLLDVKCVVFDICANVPKEGDYLSIMHENIQRLKPIFKTF